MSDAVNPAHYKRLPAEAIEIIESAIDNAPSNQDAYLHGQVLKYILRCWNKNGIEDLKKAKWYLDRLIDSFDEDEQQKAADLQSLKDHPPGKPQQPAWTPKIGDWVRIKKPSDTNSWQPEASATMDKYDGQIIQVKEIVRDVVIQDGWGFMFDWLEQVEPPLNSDKIPQGYRKLKDSSIEPRDLEDLRWSVSEGRYVEITIDEIGYANRDNWAACRKIAPVIKQSLTTEPPDGWRWLEVGEVIRNGDIPFENGQMYGLEPIKIGVKLPPHWKPIIRRNRFEVGEKVIEHLKGRICVVKEKIGVMENPCEYRVEMLDTKGDRYFFPYHLAPYIEETK